jgi:H+/Cl- antiporter ClcA
MNGGVLSLTAAAALKFGTIQITSSPMSDGLIAILLGIIAGLLGAFFINVYSRLGVLRKKMINTNLKKILEVIFFSFVTSTLFYWLSAAAGNHCEDQDDLFNEYYRF